jgi:hypothetical protein
MMTRKNLSLQGMFLAGAAAFALTGCMTNEEGKNKDFASDGQASFLVSEVDQMGQTLDEGAPAAKFGIDSSDITGELVIDPYKYDSTCKCFVRRAKFTGSEGFERIRLDSVVLVDTNGDTLSEFKPRAIGKAYHTRHVTKSKGDKEIDVVINFTVDIKHEGDTKVGVWNGTMSGSYNGQEFKTGTATNVTREVHDGHFGFPVSGSIEIDRPVFHFTVEFLGDGRAKATIKNKVNGRIHVIFIDKNYGETDPVEQ